MDAHKLVHHGLAHVPEGRRIFLQMSVQENLEMGAYSKKTVSKDDLDRMFSLFPHLEERRKQIAGTLSGGEQQMLAICRGLMGKPKVLMLDEPSLGLAPVVVNEVFRNIQRIKEAGITVILVEQNAKKSLSIADYAYVIENGRVVMSGTGKEMLENPEVAAAYLGSTRT
jgi:branched-chain amino acid transport system ATP-binding protein